jgi:hypothetical protein
VPLAVTFLEGLNLVLAFLGFAGVGVLVWYVVRGDSEREAEDAARLHYDTHGRWPDERP